MAALAEKIQSRRQLGDKLVRVSDDFGYPAGGVGHWCPACTQMHVFPLTAPNVGTFACPTFVPEQKITSGIGLRADIAGVGPSLCHYEIRNGIIRFFLDSTHRLAGSRVPLPDLPGHLRD